MSRAQQGIVREIHDEPHLDGRRLTVRFLKTQIEDRGLDAETVAERHDLGVADVYRALAYYHDHPDEMRAVEQQRRFAIDAHEELTTDPDDVRD